MADLSNLQEDGDQISDLLGRVTRKARKFGADVCDAAEEGNEIAKAARPNVSRMIGYLSLAMAEAAEAENQIPDISVKFGGGK